jgi:NADH dehydrogenase/NADH:ubiquinone oxidoreductase subunit G
LEACRENHIHVPTLCYHPALEPYGGCRLCMVEIHQSEKAPRLVAACVYPCEPGLTVQTNSPSVQQSRRITAELMLGGAFDSPEIRSLARELGVKDVRFRLEQADNCVLCGLCVRACSEIVGVSAISLIHRGLSKKVSTPFEISSSTCIGCGTCLLICPTGRLELSAIAGLRTAHRAASAYNRLYCQVCGDTDKDLQPYFVHEDGADIV